jgi:hypothetical protein
MLYIPNLAIHKMSSSSSKRNRKDKDKSVEPGRRLPTAIKRNIFEHTASTRFNNNSVEFKIYCSEEDEYINFVYDKFETLFTSAPFTQHDVNGLGTHFDSAFTTKNYRTISLSFFFSQNIEDWFKDREWFNREVYKPRFTDGNLDAVFNHYIYEEAARLSAQALQVLSLTLENPPLTWWTKTMNPQPSREDILAAMREIWDFEEKREENVIIEFALINRPQNIEVDGEQVTIRGLLKF